MFDGGCIGRVSSTKAKSVYVPVDCSSSLLSSISFLKSLLTLPSKRTAVNVLRFLVVFSLVLTLGIYTTEGKNIIIIIIIIIIIQTETTKSLMSTVRGGHRAALQA